MAIITLQKISQVKHHCVIYIIAITSGNKIIDPLRVASLYPDKPFRCNGIYTSYRNCLHSSFQLHLLANIFVPVNYLDNSYFKYCQIPFPTNIYICISYPKVRLNFILCPQLFYNSDTKH